MLAAFLLHSRDPAEPDGPFPRFTTPGSAILPVGYAFATTGAVLGIIIALVVGATNVYTCRLLIRGAQYTGTRDYESFAYAVGGRWFKVRSGRKRHLSERSCSRDLSRPGGLLLP